MFSVLIFVALLGLIKSNFSQISLTRQQRTTAQRMRASIDQRVEHEKKAAQLVATSALLASENQIAAESYLSRLRFVSQPDEFVVAFPDQVIISSTQDENAIKSFIYVPEGKHQLVVQSNKKTIRIPLPEKNVAEFRFELDDDARDLSIIVDEVLQHKFAVHSEKPLVHQLSARMQITGDTGRGNLRSVAYPSEINIRQIFSLSLGDMLSNSSPWRSFSANLLFEMTINVHIRNRLFPEHTLPVRCWIASDAPFCTTAYVNSDLFRSQFGVANAFSTRNGIRYFDPEVTSSRTADLRKLFTSWEYAESSELDDLPPKPRFPEKSE